jgi:predicted ATP-grasp superfamily ATP-dependent carboligase
VTGASRRQAADRVLLTDAQERSVLAACRSLGAAGFAVDAAASEHPAPGHWSRFCGARYAISDPRANPRLFVEELRELLAGARHRILLLGTDSSLLAVSRHRRLLDPFMPLGLPSVDRVDRSMSKLALLDSAAGSGLPSPETVICAAECDGLAAARRFGYPVVIKARQSALERDGTILKPPTALVPDAFSLAKAAPAYGTPFLVQRPIAGAAFSVGGVFADGRLLAHVASRYVRTWPPGAGNVSFSETIELPPELGRAVPTLLQSIGWEGIFELELLRGPDGRYSTIDFNPRVYGSLALAGEAGVPLAVTWCNWLLGRGVQPQCARPGHRYRWEEGELRNVLRHVRDLRLGAAASVLRPRRRTTHADFRSTDPLPLLARGLLLLRRVIRRRDADSPTLS